MNMNFEKSNISGQISRIRNAAAESFLKTVAELDEEARNDVMETLASLESAQNPVDRGLSNLAKRINLLQRLSRENLTNSENCARVHLPAPVLNF